MSAQDRRRSRSQSFYDDHVQDYAARDEEKWSSPSITALELQRVIDELEPGTVLELGTGTGRYFPFLRGVDYTGVDISTAMLRVAEERTSLLRDRGFRTITLLDQDVDVVLDGVGEPFDLVFSIGCLGLHVRITSRLMARLARAVRPGGVLFIQTPQPLQSPRKLVRASLDPAQRFHHAEITDATLRRRARSAGFAVAWAGEDPRLWNGRPLSLYALRRT